MREDEKILLKDEDEDEDDKTKRLSFKKLGQISIRIFLVFSTFEILFFD